MAHESGKGSNRRSPQVTPQTFSSNWELAFGNKKVKSEKEMNAETVRWSEPIPPREYTNQWTSGPGEQNGCS